jgi:hypothetical protein
MQRDSEHNNFAMNSNTIIRLNSQQGEMLQLGIWAGGSNFFLKCYKMLHRAQK